jgi:hypothetical protein
MMISLALTLLLWIVTVVNKKKIRKETVKKVTDRLWRIFCPSFYIRLFIELNHSLLLCGFI